ncbi:ImmA/IrrE family metallo-endopeptidase [Blautia sp.]|uniref:ImmA/IrrE family metallo-endopeptidase n=1 Tax=Blautia sp. TaxID=1955243 RepID=UPI003AB7F219
MRKLRVKRNSYGVPILTKEEIDILGERLIYDFCPEAMKKPQAIDVDLFAQDYLGMEQDYQYLSHCGLYLGMMVFQDADNIIVFNPEKKEAEYIHADAGTIIIDTSLLEVGQEKRYRFTMGHEAAGHAVLHGPYFSQRIESLSLFDKEEPLIQCRTDVNQIELKRSSSWTNRDWMEWQANAMAAAFLMPRSMVRKTIKDINLSNSNLKSRDAHYVKRVSDIFDVSIAAAICRLKDLKEISGSFSYRDMRTIENQ